MTTTSNDNKVASTGRIVTLTNASAKDVAEQQPRKRRRGTLLWSFILVVALPLFAAGLYYAAFATDRYAASAGFSIRGIDTNSGVDGIGALTGMASTGSTTSDSYIVLSYLGSRELLEAVDQQHDLRAAFSSAEVDFLSRLNAQATVEDFLRYWNRRIHTEFDPTSGIIAFEVQAPDPQNARDIAATVLTLTQSLVNELSANARSDALRFAREEVALQEARLRAALAAIRDFRASQQSVDPSASAALEIQLIANLESRLIDVNARISALRQTLDENAPSLVALLRNADALSAQIATRREAIGTDILGSTGITAMPQQLALYEELEVERSLAQQAYASALVSLEQARRDADRQQRYLAIHQRPQTAEAALYPRSLRNMLILGFALVAAWGIATLLTYSVRDHLT